LCARDFADVAACRRVAPVFADMPLRTLELRPSFEDILMGPALDIATLFKTLVGNNVRRIIADQLEVLPRGVIPTGVGASLTWLYLGPGSSSCDYSKLPQLRELHVSEDEGEIVFPARVRLPAALRVVDVHSGDAALDLNVQVIEEVERLILAEQSVPVRNVVIHKYYASDRVMVVVLHGMCTARNVKMNIAKKETKFPWRTWIRIECKLSGPKIYAPAHCHFRGGRVATRMSTEGGKSRCRTMCTSNVWRLHAEGTILNKPVMYSSSLEQCGSVLLHACHEYAHWRRPPSCALVQESPALRQRGSSRAFQRGFCRRRSLSPEHVDVSVKLGIVSVRANSTEHGL
jgi:hypothetical protein